MGSRGWYCETHLARRLFMHLKKTGQWIHEQKILISGEKINFITRESHKKSYFIKMNKIMEIREGSIE
ncbi:hypothetical protein B9Z55_006998 [Caenorhabditis nigoni]|uniref:Uncharacterized protein n=1 Tax=Caenorhabditis nigoni TaxID=1611254 RepID=A0A2G5V7S4_9PELO|nr:hypothetical protein B9Z55_006998 [Caenorhabditis nigoni]